MVEGVFVKCRSIDDAVLGFHATFFVDAPGAPSASAKAGKLMLSRMAGHSVVAQKDGFMRSYYWVRDIWEIDQEKFCANVGLDSGFTFFRIGGVESIFLAFRRMYFVRLKNWIMI